MRRHRGTLTALLANLALSIPTPYSFQATGSEAAAADERHHEESNVSIDSLSGDQVSGGPVVYRFQLLKAPKGLPLRDNDLRFDRERLLHLFTFDEALKEFQHVHAVFKNGHWEVDLNFVRNGNYRLWAQGQLKRSGEEFTAMRRLTVVNALLANAPTTVLGNVRVGTDNTSRVSLSNEPLRANRMAMLTIHFDRTDGSQPQLSPYLGVPAHVVIVPVGGDSLIHSHAQPGERPSEMRLHAEFAQPGDYRIWIEFIDAGQLRVVPLSVTVGD